MYGTGCLTQIVLCATALALVSPVVSAQQNLSAPLDVQVPAPPWAFEANGKWHLVYELHISNAGSEDCTITQIEVISADSQGRSLATIGSPGLAAIFVHPGAEVPSDPSRIQPAAFAVVYMWVSVEKREDIPAGVIHRINVRCGAAHSWTTDTPATPINRGGVPAISAPLRGNNWGASRGPSNDSGHRRGLLPVNGRAYIAERFAIDWVRITPAGQTYSGDSAENTSYPAYGAVILAVADATVTQVQDGIPQNTPGADSTAVPISMDTLAGNYVLLQLSSEVFAFYAHLQPGSIRVKEGEKVRRGQALGLVGNSGNSGEPHLHFHLCNANSRFACEGIPYALDYVEQDHVTDGNSSTFSSGRARHMQLPLDQTLTGFPQ